MVHTLLQQITYISMDGEAAIAVLVFIGSGQWIPGKMPLQPSVLG